MITRRVVAPPGRFRAEVEVPGDKSLSHRALIMAAMAEGLSEVHNLGPGGDVAAMVAALGALGIDVAPPLVRSSGISGWTPPEGAIDAANSATTLRLLAGAVAGRPFQVTLTGDASLRGRPMERVAEPLRRLGARAETTGGGAPVTIRGGNLTGTEVVLDVASAQVRTAFALAALQAQGSSVIDGPGGFRDHTERRLAALGLGEWKSETAFRIDPGPVPVSSHRIPGDTSSAAFLLAAAALRPGAAVHVRDLTLNPGRLGFVEILAEMGATVEMTETGARFGDPIGDVTVTGAGLVGVTVADQTVPRAIDELPLVAVLGAAAEGTTIIEGAGELRFKESDRLEATAAAIGALGGGVRVTGDGLEVTGGTLEGGVVQSRGDHRIAMAAAVAALACPSGVVIEGADAAAVSWPGFYDVLERAWSSQ